MSPEEPQETIEDHVRGFSKFMDRAWADSGVVGRAFLVLLYLCMAAPLIVEFVGLIVVVMWLLPFEGTYLERLATFGVLFGLLEVLAVRLASGGGRALLGTYLLLKPKRRRRRGKALTPVKEGAEPPT